MKIKIAQVELFKAAGVATCYDSLLNVHYLNLENFDQLSYLAVLFSFLILERVPLYPNGAQTFEAVKAKMCYDAGYTLMLTIPNLKGDN